MGTIEVTVELAIVGTALLGAVCLVIDSDLVTGLILLVLLGLLLALVCEAVFEVLLEVLLGVLLELLFVLLLLLLLLLELVLPRLPEVPLDELRLTRIVLNPAFVLEVGLELAGAGITWLLRENGPGPGATGA